MNIGYMIRSTERLKKVANPLRELMMRQKDPLLMFKYSFEFLNPFAMKSIKDIEALDNIASITDATTTNSFMYLRVFFFSLKTWNSVASSLSIRHLAKIT